MRSIYEEALGDKYKQLHPKLQERFRLHSQLNLACIGRGVMKEIWTRPFFIRPFLHIGSKRHLLVPEQGRDIPFSIENYAYKDSFDRETIAWIRSFYFENHVRRFDATMIYSKNRKRVIDYLGTHQHLAVDIELTITEDGGLRLVSKGQRLYEGVFGIRFPMIFSGVAQVHEWYDEKEENFKIDVRVSNKLLGSIFGYTGSFDVEYRKLKQNEIPPYAKPLREEIRD